MGPDEPPEYGRTIVSLLESFSQVSYLPSVAGILEDTCQMERRIKMIADYKKTPRPRWAGAILLLIALAFIVLTNAYVAKADFIFGAVTNLGAPVNTSSLEGFMCISPDGLELYFNSPRPGGSGGQDLWLTTRATTLDEWGEPVNVGATVNWAGSDWAPGMSADGLQLYFTSDRPGGSGGEDIWVTTRATTEDDWGPPENLGPMVNSSDADVGARMPVDGLSLFFTSNRPGGSGNLDIWVTTRARKDQPWGQPENLGSPVNSSADDCAGSISADGLQLYFSEWAVIRPGGYGGHDIWVATRPTKDAPWGQPANLGPSVNTAAGEVGPFISPDGSTLYFSSDRSGGYGRWDIWQVKILPVVDFNADGSIDTDDLLIMIDNWDTDESLCDIGPMPWGDGVVNIEDLIVFMEYWEKENMPEPSEEEL
jgi:Tol biopolymer transport system component